MLERVVEIFAGGIVWRHMPGVPVSFVLGVVVAGELEPPDYECEYGVASRWRATGRGHDGRTLAGGE